MRSPKTTNDKVSKKQNKTKQGKTKEILRKRGGVKSQGELEVMSGNTSHISVSKKQWQKCRDKVISWSEKHKNRPKEKRILYVGSILLFQRPASQSLLFLLACFFNSFFLFYSFILTLLTFFETTPYKQLKTSLILHNVTLHPGQEH